MNSLSAWEQTVQDLRSDDIETAIRASLMIPKLADETRVAELYQLIEDDDFLVLESAARPLLDLEGIRALPTVLQAHARHNRHNNDGLSDTVAWFLETHAAESAPLLVEMLDSDDSELRNSCAWATSYVSEHISPDILIEVMYAEADLDVRCEIISSLSRYKGNPNVVDVLIDTLSVGNEQLKLSAVSALGALDDRRAVQPLRDLLPDDTKMLKSFIKRALKQLEG